MIAVWVNKPSEPSPEEIVGPRPGDKTVRRGAGRSGTGDYNGDGSGSGMAMKRRDVGDVTVAT